MRSSILLAAAASVVVSAASQPVFRSGTDLVRFDLRVIDASGRPVTDLRPDELEIIENGQPLPILLFQHLSEPPDQYAEAALRSVSAEVSSNRGAPHGHLYVVVFDQAHMAPGNEQLARRAAETFIKTRVRPSDRVAVVGIPGPGPELGFTTDRTRAIAEVAKVQTVDQTGDTLQRLSDALAQYRSVEGRKTVLFFSEGFHQREASSELEDVAAAAAQGHAVFYAFDLTRRAGSGIAETPARTESLGSLAAETGGALITDLAADVDAALARVADRGQDYYLVGFTPGTAAPAARGHYRRVSVRVRRPGARVSARTGYALAQAGPPLDRRRTIEAALAAPFPHQALPIDYTTYTLRSDSAGRTRVTLSLEVELPVHDEARDSADVAFIVRNARDGRVVASGTDIMPLPSTPTEGRATGVSAYRAHFDVPPGSYVMRAVVREPGGLLGSADRKLDVRGLSGAEVTVGDVILGSVTGGLPVRARAYAQDGLTGTIDAYSRSPGPLQQLTVNAAVVPAGGAQPVVTGRAELGETMSGGTGVVRRATFAIPLAGVAPGRYVVRVTVTAGSTRIADLSRELDVVAGSKPRVSPEPRITRHAAFGGLR
jgi:VWFA-related protein